MEVPDRPAAGASARLHLQDYLALSKHAYLHVGKEQRRVHQQARLTCGLDSGSQSAAANSHTGGESDVHAGGTGCQAENKQT